MYFEVFRDDKKELRWRLIAGNGKTVAVSGEGYKRMAGVNKSIAVVKKSVDAEVFADESERGK